MNSNRKNILYARSKKFLFIKKKGLFTLISSNKRNILELNELASFIWKQLEKPKTITSLFSLIENKYEVSKPQILQDLNKWLKKAIEEGYVVKEKNSSIRNFFHKILKNTNKK